VIESRKQGGMGAAEAVPYGNRESAGRFAAANGGRVVRSRKYPRTYVLAAITAGDQTDMMLPTCAQLNEDRPMPNS